MVHSFRPTIAEIDLDALAHNYHQIRRLVHPGVKMMAVVKDNAYGHGAVIVARELEKLGVDMLGVAITEEGLELRNGGIKKPILILTGIRREEIDAVIEYDLIPMIFDDEVVRALSRTAVKRNKRVNFTTKERVSSFGNPLYKVSLPSL